MVKTPTTNDTIFGLDISEANQILASLRRKVSKRFLLIEFGIDSLTYCEAKVIKDQVYCSKVNRISIEKKAIERGTPTDAETMASFISQIIDEEQILAHRVGITLPPQAALSKTIYLPDHLNYKEAIEYISNPSSSGFQFPIPLENTDFDIVPLSCIPIDKKNKTKAYFLSSIPKKLVDNVITTLTEAGLELHSLDISYSSLGRLAITEINKLEKKQAIILIELSLECTHFQIISVDGPIHVNTLAAIKPFNTKENYQGEKSIEEHTISSEDYLAISQLDLKVLFNEIKDELDNLKSKYNLQFTEIILSGINSSHPGINNFFKDRFNIKIKTLRSLSSVDIGEVNLAKPMAMQDLNRIIGLGLSIIQSEDIEEDGIESTPSKVKNQKIVDDSSYGQSKENDINLPIENNMEKDNVDNISDKLNLDSNNNKYKQNKIEVSNYSDKNLSTESNDDEFIIREKNIQKNESIIDFDTNLKKEIIPCDDKSFVTEPIEEKDLIANANQEIDDLKYPEKEEDSNKNSNSNNKPKYFEEDNFNMPDN